MDLDPRLLRYLRAIDENGTFIRAAEAEGISQPGLTNKIGLLERQLGTKLIDRGRFGARLNRYGKMLLRHARAVDAIIDQAAAEIDLARIGESGPLVVGGTPISMVELVPRALDRLDRQNPRIRIELIEADDDVLLDKLHAGEIDLMLGGLLLGQREHDVVEEPLINFPLQAVVGRSNSLWGRDRISLKDLSGHSWALPAAGSVIRSYVDAIFVSAGESIPAGFWSCSSMHGLKSVIQHTRRVSLMPSHAFALEAGNGVLKGLRLVGVSSSRKLNILRLRHLPLSPVARLFVDHLLSAGASIGEEGAADAHSVSRPRREAGEELAEGADPGKTRDRDP